MPHVVLFSSELSLNLFGNMWLKCSNNIYKGQKSPKQEMKSTLITENNNFVYQLTHLVTFRPGVSQSHFVL